MLNSSLVFSGLSQEGWNSMKQRIKIDVICGTILNKWNNWCRYCKYRTTASWAEAIYNNLSHHSWPWCIIWQPQIKITPLRNLHHTEKKGSIRSTTIIRYFIGSPSITSSSFKFYKWSLQWGVLLEVSKQIFICEKLGQFSAIVDLVRHVE